VLSFKWTLIVVEVTRYLH